MFSQRRRTKFRCNACRPRGEFATNSRVFFGGKKKCAIAERAVFSARNTALTCGEAAPTSCEFQIRILTKEDAKFGAPRAEIVKKLQQIRASMMQILAKFCACSTAGCARVRHCTRHKLDAEILQRQNVFAATPAEILVRCTSTAQKICNEFARFL